MFLTDKKIYFLNKTCTGKTDESDQSNVYKSSYD